MATFSAKVFKHHKKADGTYNVKICISHNRDRRYIDTVHYVNDKKLTKDLTIKDPFLNTFINATLDDYRAAASKLGKRLDFFDVENLRDFLLNKDQVIDFIKFCQIHLDALKANDQTKSEANYKTVRNSLSDFVRGQPLPIENITVSFIGTYERYLRNEREMVRKDQFGREYKMKGKALGDASVHCYLRDFQGFFTAAMTFYNKPSLGLIPITYNPFEEYKIVEAPTTEKRNLSTEQLLKVKNAIPLPGSRAELAQKLSLLSFYLCGINAVDLYKMQYEIVNGRVEYKRSKTRGKRKDQAFISIKLVPEAVDLLKYASTLPERYASITNLNQALSRGMVKLSTLTKTPGLQYYKFRHTFGTLARNECKIPKDNIAEALNHVDHGKKTTDIYLAKDWTIIDEVQIAVIRYVRRVEMKLKGTAVRSTRPIFAHIQLPKLTT
ncbi:Phage integrase SAM-like domain-containing protein [Mucilaginibacter pineti]|uniref:Phage integrase SAM-like domain-containing protein n=1 Tax=Mucilaginibacter pineti TaxID=1391627 RepID=A0A1G7NA05_9SPHI|nr:phage integrase SAM-like domain-containing protein [Mucilaginibacter pineti]SDF70766.1 Phage integrase SAM-like domain-containing protein [Mucilaginibacter pineti]